MPNQQIYQVNDSTPVAPALSAVFPYQAADGATPMKISTLTQIKSSLLLSNVDNTSDASKPVSTLQAAAIALKVQYKCEIAYISQASTGAPTVNTLVKHDFSTAVVYTRSSAGVYLATITSSEFTSGKSIALMTNGTNGNGVVEIGYQDANNIQIVTRNFSGTSSDGILSFAVFKIEVYP